MFLFLAGSFTASLIISFPVSSHRFSYLIPILIEMMILLFSALFGYRYNGTLVSKEIFAGSLLFAMGLQNALVSVISGSVVRTTHLTGTFTDLGIELAQLVNSKTSGHPALKSKIKLRLVIILFFMTGAVFGAYVFHFIGFRSFFIPVVLLFFALLYDILRIKARRVIRRTIAWVR
jgi:uncharacterized membrane protein YoaK (UPF0700 family)